MSLKSDIKQDEERNEEIECSRVERSSTMRSTKKRKSEM